MRGKHGALIGVVEDVRILVSADPAQRIHLERTLADVGVERGKLKAYYLQSNPYVEQLLLQNHRQQSAGFISRGLHRQAEADAVFGTLPTCLIQQGIGFCRIIWILLNVPCPGPMLRW